MINGFHQFLVMHACLVYARQNAKETGHTNKSEAKHLSGSTKHYD